MTGGGFPENLPRILPEGKSCIIDRAAWDVPHMFVWLQGHGAHPVSPKQ